MNAPCFTLRSMDQVATYKIYPRKKTSNNNKTNATAMQISISQLAMRYIFSKPLKNFSKITV